MKLIGDFFKVLDTSVSEAVFSTTIELNPSHIVYSGHFPGYPVTPGVIQLQIVHELLERQFDRKLKLINMPQCKFLKVLNPKETSQIVVNIEFENKERLISIKAWGRNDTDIYFKFQSNYQL